jgi:hypothetical protein
MKIIKEEVSKIDLSHLVDNITREEHKKLIMSPAGKEHYKLLTYLTRQLNNVIIVELGTHNGTSSLCLCDNILNKVVTFDLRNVYSVKKQPVNLTRHVGNVFEIDPSILLKSDLIFLDTAHNGDFEKEIYLYLLNNKYKGILVLDDIFFNNEMVQFWNFIDIKKYDISSIGHGENHPTPSGLCGTGLVDFSNIVEII